MTDTIMEEIINESEDECEKMTDTIMEEIINENEDECENIVGLDDEEEIETFVIISEDNVRVSFNKKAMIRFSSTIRNLVEGDRDTDLVLSLHNRIGGIPINGDVVKKIADWVHFYENGIPSFIDKPIRASRDEYHTLFKTDREKEFMKSYVDNIQFEMVSKIILTANYLGMEDSGSSEEEKQGDLLHCMCAWVALQIKGEDPKKIKKILGIEEDVVNSSSAELTTEE